MALSRSLAWIVVDVVTLVTACALNVDPNGLTSRPDPMVMQLIWQQSGGEPWSLSAPRQGWPRVFPTVQDAIREARASVGGQIRVGLTGLPANGPAATAEMFAPCLNIAFATSQIAQLAERCKTLWRFKADPIYCAIAAYHGSWERPDAVFADAVKATVVKGDAQNFDMSGDAYFDTDDAAGDALKPDPHAAPIALGAPFDDHDRAWSSALFPLKLPQAERSSTDVPIAARLQSKCFRLGGQLQFQQRSSHQPTVCLFRVRLDGALVARLRMFRVLSIVFACLSVRQGEGRPLDRMRAR
jgi:hypothetical protein